MCPADRLLILIDLFEYTSSSTKAAMGEMAKEKTGMVTTAEHLHSEQDALDLASLDLIGHVQLFARSLSDKQVAVRGVWGRVVALRAALLDQSASTMRAVRIASLTRVRLREAENAIAQTVARTAELSATQASRQERDAARALAARLTLRVEILKDWAGSGRGASLRARCSRLDVHAQQLAGQITCLEKLHQSLLSAASSMVSAAEQGMPTRLRGDSVRIELEAQWTQMAACLDRCVQFKACTKMTNPVDQSRNLILKDIEAPSCESVHSLCLQIEGTCSLFIK